jgi:hypothetical protein
MRSFTLTKKSLRCWTVCVKVLSVADWEVPVHLRGRAVELRRDPFDQARIEVWLALTLPT